MYAEMVGLNFPGVDCGLDAREATELIECSPRRQTEDESG